MTLSFDYYKDGGLFPGDDTCTATISFADATINVFTFGDFDAYFQWIPVSFDFTPASLNGNLKVDILCQFSFFFLYWDNFVIQAAIP